MLLLYSMETGLHDSGHIDIIDYDENRPLVPVQLSARIGNYVIDSIFQYALIFGLTYMSLIAEETLSGFNGYAFGYLVSFLYYVLFESITGKTPGKWITKTKVVTIEGYEPSSMNIIGRTLCRFIPLDGISFLFTNGVGWHDSISRTRVVRDNGIPARL